MGIIAAENKPVAKKICSAMYDIGLKDIQDIFKLADSKNISYKEFCTRYNRYTTEWLYTHNLAESPIKQIEAAIDFQRNSSLPVKSMPIRDSKSWRPFCALWKRRLRRA